MNEGRINDGFAHLNAGRLQDAELAARDLLGKNPGNADAWRLLGLVAEKVGKFQFAVEAFSRSAALAPNVPELHFSLGNALRAIGKLDLAIGAYQAALAIRPDYADVLINIGIALSNSGRRDEAEAHWKRALELDGNDSDALTNLSNHCRAVGRVSEAVAFGERALSVRPGSTAAMNNLAFAYQQQGRLDEAIAQYRRLVQLSPGAGYSHSNLLLNLQYSDAIPPAEVFAEHRRWSAAHEAPCREHRSPHQNDRSPDRPLRVGYVSPDFREHAVTFFIEPLLERHRRQNVEIYCYSAAPTADAATQRLRGLGHAWRSIVGIRDAQVAQMVRDDRIDILVDLAVHTSGHRLRVFAHKPAPVQASWLGYAGTTGLESIDWRITDPIVDPPGLTEPYHSEKLFRLPRTQWSYRPPPGAPEVIVPGPSERNGFVTFGNATNLAKVTPTTLDLWAGALVANPDARLAVKSQSFADEPTRQRMLKELERRGLSADRVTLEAGGDLADYFAFLARLDICLDTFPFAGGTTTCHTLWSGVPVVTMTGQSSVSRVAASVLTNVGLAELISDRPDQFVRIATALAGDRARLAGMRGDLRAQMRRSPLMDECRFADDIEAAFRVIWRKYLADVPA